MRTQTTALDFQGAGWVLLTRFDNQTGESVFDGTLEYLLQRELVESSLVQVVSRDRIRDSLALMKKPMDSPIDQTLGREICLRDGQIRAMVVGRLGKLGSRYLLNVHLVDPSSGAVLASTEQEAQGNEHLLSSVGSVAEWVRVSLGEQVSGSHQGEEQFERLTYNLG